MVNDIKVLCHSCIKISKEQVIYIDPFKIKEEYNDADVIMITHSHYDHYSEIDILKVKKKDTIIVITSDLYEKVLNIGFNLENIVIVEPNQDIKINNMKITAIPSYNINKKFHPKGNNWVGYILEINNNKYYIAGDTDITEENKEVKCDVAFVPVGGTYTMDAKEAAKLINIINPKIAVPIHYGDIVGTIKDAKEFKDLINSKIKCEILMY